MGFELPWNAEAIDAACQAVLVANGLTDGYVRPIAWLGSEELAVSSRGTKVHMAIARMGVAELFRRPRGWRASGWGGGVEAALA